MSLLFAGIPGVQGGEAQLAPMFPTKFGDYRVYELELDKYTGGTYMINTIRDLVGNTREYDELMLVGVSMGGIAAIELAKAVRHRLPAWKSLRLLLISAPFPGSAKTLVGAGKAAGVLARLSGWPNGLLKFGNPIVRAMSGSPLEERGLGSTDQSVEAAHQYGATIPFARYARQVSWITDTAPYVPGDLDGVFDAVGYLGADNHGSRNDGVVDWRAARDQYAAVFGTGTPFYDLGVVKGPHAAIPNYPFSYEMAIRRFMEQSRKE